MSLVRPILNPIPAFDATEDFTITFVASGGDEVTGNELKIVTNDTTQTVVFDDTVSSGLLQHTIPANTLTNGVYYYATLRTFNSSSASSEWSLNKPFYCFAEPTLSFNIEDGSTITTDTIAVSLTYNQTDGEHLSSGVIELYTSGSLYATSDELYDSSAPPNILYWEFDLENDKTYTLVGRVTTEYGTVVTTTISFNVSYSSHTGTYFYAYADNCTGEVIIQSEPIVATDSGLTPSFHGMVDGTSSDFITYNDSFYINLVSLDGIDSLYNSSQTYANVSWSLMEIHNFTFFIKVIPALINNEIARFTNAYSGYNKYISISVNRGDTQDYVSIRTNNGTIIDKGIGVFCNDYTSLLITLRMLDGELSLEARLANEGSSRTLPILDWNNNNNNNVYYSMATDIVFRGEGGGSFVPNSTVINKITDTFTTLTIGNGLYSTIILSASPYIELTGNDPSYILNYAAMYSSWTNLAVLGLNKAVIDRKNGDNWITLNEISLIPNSINYITFIDRYAPIGSVTYRLRISSPTYLFDSTITTNIQWKYVFISDVDETYRLQSGIVYSNNQQNIQNNILMPIGATYPIVIQNANGNYRSGSVQFTVLGYEFDQTYRVDRLSMTQELNDILKFLTNTKPKVIKDYNGNLIICRIVNSPQVSFDANYGNSVPKVSFDWVEQGDYNDLETMKELGFIS